MNQRQPDLDARSMVVVPARPGPLVRLQNLDRGHDEIDELLDDVFGEPDDRGPGPVDAVLVVGGAGAVIAGLTASLPTVVTVAGIAAVGLGAVLPLRSLWRRIGSARRSSRLQSVLGEGVLLRIDHPSIEQLLAAHQRLLTVAPRLRLHRAAECMTSPTQPSSRSPPCLEVVCLAPSWRRVTSSRGPARSKT